jgi:hypothetical protein
VLPGRDTVSYSVLYVRLVTVFPAAVSVIVEVDKMIEVAVASAALSVTRSVDVANEVLRTVEVAALSVLVGAIVLVLVTLV